MSARHEIAAGCRMPTDRGINQLDRARENEARLGCEALARRIEAYLAKLRAERGEAAHG